MTIQWASHLSVAKGFGNYFTRKSLNWKPIILKLPLIWQELVEYQLIDECTCEGLKKMIDFLNVEFVMIFLMGLNESYSQIRA